MGEFFWMVFVATAAGVVGFAAVLVGWALRNAWRESRLARAREEFHRRREWLEVEFLKKGSRQSKPRGLKWGDCEFENAVSFARDKRSGHLRALVGVAIRFTAEDEEIDDLEGLGQLRAATAVFFFEQGKWFTDGRTLFNMSPAQAMRRYQHELETAD